MANIKSIIKNHQAISWVLLLGFLATVAYAFYFRVNITVDAQAYDSIAISLVQGTGYTEIQRPEIPEAAIGRLGPGYEFFLAGIYFLFGHTIWLVWVIQALLHTASAFLVFLLIRRFLKEPEWPAVLGAGTYIFFIDLLEFPAMLLTETLYLFLGLLAYHFIFNYVERARTKDAVWVAILMALAILVRPPITIAMAVFFGFILLRKHYRQALIFLATVVIILTPWTVRNYLRYHKFIVTSAIIGYDVWVGNSPDSKYTGELVATNEIDRFSEAEGLFAANERGKQEVIDLALKHPWQFIELQLTKTSIYFSAARPAAFWFHIKGMVQLVTIFFSSSFAYLIFGFGLAGFWLFARRKDSLSRLFALLAVAAPVGIIWVVAETRYRYQIYPLMIIFGSVFLYEFLKNRKAYWKVLAVSFVLITANTAFDLIQNSARVLERLQRLF